MKNKIIKSIILVFLFCAVFLAVGCEKSTNTERQSPKPHLYWKDIDVEVINVEKFIRFSPYHRARALITVYSNEYDLSESFSVNSYWSNYKVGDFIKAELYSWVDDNTGKILKREIHRIY